MGLGGSGLLRGYSGAARSFAPTDLGGLQFWYDFSDAGTLFTDPARLHAVAADGDGIGGVYDKSGQGRHLMQPASASRPLYKTNVLNGHSVARGDGSAAFLYGGAFGPSLAGVLLCAAVRFTTLAGGTTPYVCDGIASGNRQAIWHQDGGYLGLHAGTAVTTYQAAVAGTWYVLCALFSGSTSALYRNGGDVRLQTSSGNPGSHTMTGLTLLRSYNGSGSVYLAGDIAEIIGYSPVLSDADRQSVEAYLA